MFVVVVEFKGFNGNGHQGSGEEHAKCIFKCKRKVFMGLVVVLLQMGEIMQDITHYEFVEKDDTKQGSPGDYGGNGLSS